MRSEPRTEGAQAGGALAIYLERIDLAAFDDVELRYGRGAPGAHCLWLLLPTVVFGVLTQSTPVLAIGATATFAWAALVVGYYWRAHRRYRIEMGLPADSLTRYWIRNGSIALARAAVFVGAYEMILRFA